MEAATLLGGGVAGWRCHWVAVTLHGSGGVAGWRRRLVATLLGGGCTALLVALHGDA
jgi:hypothetical protein